MICDASDSRCYHETEQRNMETYVLLLHPHRVQHMSQELVRILLPKIKILVVFATDYCQQVSEENVRCF